MTTWTVVFKPICTRVAKAISWEGAVIVQGTDKHEAARAARALAMYRGFGHYAITEIRKEGN